MKTEIEQIIEADEAAARIVDAAMTESRRIRAEAEQKAKEILAQKENDLETVRTREVEKIISEARSKASAVLAEADGYLERLHHKKEEEWEGLVNELLRRITGA
jgi:vacuolar-type H+-ATPase subunit H